MTSMFTKKEKRWKRELQTNITEKYINLFSIGNSQLVKDQRYKISTANYICELK